jgi:hypothetical protein
MAWYILKQRRSRAKRRLITTPYVKTSSTTTLPQATVPKPSLHQTAPDKKYTLTTMTIQSTRRPIMSPPPRNSCGSLAPGNVLSEPLKSVRPKAKGGDILGVLTPQVSNLQRGPSARSVDTESVYSAASAPLDFHDVLQGWEFETIPNSPVTSPWGNSAHLPSVMSDSGIIWPHWPRASSSEKSWLRRHT